ncbi:MAG: LTA synthase family protein [Myxococcales bacterium]
MASTFRTRFEAVRKSGTFLLLSLLLSPIALRIALVRLNRVHLEVADVRGFFSDAAMTGVVALVALLVSRLSEIAAWVLLVAWLALNHANFEHVAFLGTFLDPTYASYLSDSTFLLGSGLAVSRPVLLAVVAVASSALFALARPWRGTWLLPAAGFAVVALIVSLALPLRDENLLWRQGHCLQLNVGRAFAPGRVRVEPAKLPPPDLAGEPVVAMPRPRTNVLLVMLESISGAYVPSVAADHGIESPTKMRTFDALAKRGLLFTNFVSQQRQTNRGEYALLCGDHPRLLTAEAKMTAFIRAGARRCLPAILREAGYETVYMQAASLAFMFKDQFMPRSGFDRSIGSSGLPRSYARSEWGLDDRALFEQAFEHIEELREGDKPWFFALLTVGTHHPFLVPDDFDGAPGEKGMPRAIAYADVALGELFERLERAGVFEDTLVIVTSDESAGLFEGYDDLTRAFSQNWSVLAAFVPTGETARVSDVYAQSDLGLSVLDYLGLADRADGMTGRSLFRRYEQPRTVYFANTYRHSTHAVETGGKLVVCREDFFRCTRRSFEPGRLFSPVSTLVPADEGEILALKAMAEQSVKDFERADQRIKLITDREVEVLEDSKYQIVFAGQYLTVEPGTRIEMDLEVEIEGGEGSVRFTHDMASQRGRHFGRWLHGLKAGDSVSFHYSFTTAERIERLESRVFVARESGSGLRLKIGEATLGLLKAPPDAKPGLEVRHEEVRRASEQPGANAAPAFGQSPS